MKTVFALLAFGFLASYIITPSHATHRAHHEVFVYFHGGPGLNSNPETNLLTQVFNNKNHLIFFWNEPSKLRPNGFPFQSENSYGNMLRSAEVFLENVYQLHGKVNVLAHSYGSVVAQHLALQPSTADMIQSITIISPALNIAAADRNIMNLVLGDFENAKMDQEAKTMREILADLPDAFVGNKIKGYQVGLQDRALFTHYFVNSQIMGAYFSHLQAPEFQFDVESLFSVRATAHAIDCTTAAAIPTHLIFGENDPVVKKELELPLDQQCFGNLDQTTFSQAGHFPHLEKMDEFMTFIEQTVLK